MGSRLYSINKIAILAENKSGGTVLGKNPFQFKRKTKYWLVFLCSIASTTMLFNNCSKGFVSNDDQAAESNGFASTTPSQDVPVTAPITGQPISTANQPAWMNGHSLNEWIEIPKTAGAGGSMIDAWGQIVLREDTNELFILASGGHGDSADNRVVSLKLTDDSPQWILRNAPTPANQLIKDAAYNADGKPTSRHNYQYNHWVPAVHRFMMFGLYGTWPDAWAFPTVDGFNPDNNTWDPAGTWPDLAAGAGHGVCVDKTTGAVWTNGLMRWDPITKQYSAPITHRSGELVNYPVAIDSLRNQLFSFQYGDSVGYDTNLGIQSSRIPMSGDTQYKVTFKQTDILNQIMSESPYYPGMDYDAANDRFLLYIGQSAAPGKIYVITPNSTNAWDIGILPLAAGSPMPPAVPGAGVNGRFVYVPSLKGFVHLPSNTANLWFIRTSN